MTSKTNDTNSKSNANIDTGSIYDTTAGIGRFFATARAFIGTVVALVLIGGGIYFLVKGGENKGDSDTSANVTGLITAINCTDDSNSMCTLNVSYTYNNQSYSSVVKSSSSDKYQVGNDLNLVIDPQQPLVVQRIGVNEMSNKTMGIILICVGVFIIFISWLIRWGTQKSKGFAAFEGVSGVAGLFRGNGI